VILLLSHAQAAVLGGVSQVFPAPSTGCFAKDGAGSKYNISDKIIIDEIPVLWNNCHTARIR
jgi:hypothetical protein